MDYRSVSRATWVHRPRLHRRRTHRETNCGRNHVDGKREWDQPRWPGPTDPLGLGIELNRAGDRRDVASHLDGHLSPGYHAVAGDDWRILDDRAGVGCRRVALC